MDSQKHRRETRPCIGAVIRANFEESENGLMRRIDELVRMLSASNRIARVVLSAPDNDFHRSLSIGSGLSVYFGNPREMLPRMIDTAHAYHLDTLVDIPLRSRLEPVEVIDQMVRFHLASGGGYTEPDGWASARLPRIVDADLLSHVCGISRRWPYYGTIHREGIRANYFAAPMERLLPDMIEKMDILHLATLQAQIRNQLKTEDNTRNPYEWVNRSRDLLRQIRAYLSKESTRVLEIGCGQRFGLGILLHLTGGISYTGIDLDTIRITEMDIDAFRKFLLLEAEAQKLSLAAALDSLASVSPRKGETVFYGGSVRFLSPVDAAALPFEDEAFDAVFSDAVLEHVSDPEMVISEIERVLRPGGIALHAIDFRDHHPDGGGFRHWYQSKTSWHESIHQVPINLLQFHDFSRIFDASGSICLNRQITAAPDCINTGRIHEDYRVPGSDDPPVSHATVIFRRRRIQ